MECDRWGFRLPLGGECGSLKMGEQAFQAALAACQYFLFDGLVKVVFAENQADHVALCLHFFVMLKQSLYFGRIGRKIVFLLDKQGG